MTLRDNQPLRVDRQRLATPGFGRHPLHGEPRRSSEVNPILQVTPNGPWNKNVHPAIPLSTDELLADLEACFRSGANGVHLHVRDDAGFETFDPEQVNTVCERVRRIADELAVPVEIGLTTGAWIVPDLRQRIAMIREWHGVDCATVNVSEDGFESVATALAEVGIGIDAALWAPHETARLVSSGVLWLARRISIEMDPGEPYFLDGDPLQLAASINDELDQAGSRCSRLTHGAAEWTWPMVREAFLRGHDTRVGFEDTILLPDGAIASSNAQLVQAARSLCRTSTIGAVQLSG